VFAGRLIERKRLFGELHMTADLGVRGDGYDTEAALQNLTELKGHITDDFPTVRDASWKRYACIVSLTVLFATPGALLFYGAVESLWGIPPVTDGMFNSYVATAIAFFWIPFGVAVGLFLEFSFSVDRAISYETLQRANPGRWKPEQRF